MKLIWKLPILSITALLVVVAGMFASAVVMLVVVLIIGLLLVGCSLFVPVYAAFWFYGEVKATITTEKKPVSLTVVKK